MITGRSPKKDAAVGAALLLFLVRMLADARVPFLSLVDLGFHELGHLVTYPLPPVITAAAGSFFQIAVPFGLAAYFFIRDEAATALCLGWSATNALDVARYMADAPYERLPLLGGGMHDWAYVFGHLNLMARSQEIADFVRLAGWLMFIVATVILAWPYLKVVREKPSARTA